MSKLDVTQLKDAFERSQSGRGFRLADVEQLRDFASYARGQASVVCNVETFEVRDEFEVPRIDLSVYQGGAEEQALPAVERVALSEEALQEVLAAIEREGIRCLFQVWADEL
jgi:hypothetical protein